MRSAWLVRSFYLALVSQQWPFPAPFAPKFCPNIILVHAIFMCRRPNRFFAWNCERKLFASEQPTLHPNYSSIFFCGGVCMVTERKFRAAWIAAVLTCVLLGLSMSAMAQTEKPKPEQFSATVYPQAGVFAGRMTQINMYVSGY